MLNTNEVKKAKHFWKWFLENYLSYEFLPEMYQDQRSEKLDEINTQVSKYCKGLSVNIDPNMNKNRGFRITITANGDSSYFQAAKDLVAYAPQIDNWYFSALVPPVDKSIQLRFKINESMVLDPALMFVVLGEVVGYPNYMAVAVYFDQYDENNMELMNELKEVIAKLINNLIGEESWAKNVQYLQIGGIPANHEMNCRPLNEIDEMIADFRKETPCPVIVKDSK
jgi:hypothetical protein